MNDQSFTLPRQRDAAGACAAGELHLWGYYVGVKQGPSLALHR
jgi:hypothetical protein